MSRRDRVHVFADYNNGGDYKMALAIGKYVNALCGATRSVEDVEAAAARPKPLICERCQELDDWRHGRNKRKPIRKSTPKDQPTYVYRCYDAEGHLLYVGCTNAPPKRLASHRKSAWWWPQVASVRCIVFPDRAKAGERERHAIFHERPRCNVKGRWHADDPRTDWTAEDYLIYRHAVLETNKGHFGTATTALLVAIERELADRFGVTAIARRPA